MPITMTLSIFGLCGSDRFGHLPCALPLRRQRLSYSSDIANLSECSQRDPCCCICVAPPAEISFGTASEGLLLA